MKSPTTFGAAVLALGTLGASAAQAQLPDPGLAIDPEGTALVLIDPQNDFLSPDGVTWGLVGKSITANGTVENIERLLKTAKKTESPSSCRPTTTTPPTRGGSSAARWRR